MTLSTNLKALAIAAGLAIVSSFQVSAQKKVLDHDVYDSWQSVSGTSLTSDGKFLSYTVNPQEGDGELIIKNLVSGAQVNIPRGSAVKLSQDGKWAVCTIKATFEQTRAQRIGKVKKDDANAPKDTIAYVNLSNMTVTKVAGATSIKTARENISRIIYNSTDKKGSKLVILDPATGKADTLKNVDKSTLNGAGDRLAVVTKKDKADSLSKTGVVIYKIPSMEVIDFSSELSAKKSFSALTFDETGTMAWFLATSDTVASGSKMESIYLFKETPAT